MKIKPFSKKQLRALTWWAYSDCDALICDGAVRSGKTFSMSISFIAWSFYRFSGHAFAICGKTVKSARRNIIVPIVPILRQMGYEVREKLGENKLIITYRGRENLFYVFGGKDEGSASLIQGMTLSGVLFDEVALMPRSFVEQALARCSVEGSKFWFNCNPENPAHWFYREWIKRAKSRNALYLHFTMRDNPSLSQEMIERYERLYSGSFYERFVLGKWVAVSGAVYPFMTEEMFVKPPDGGFDSYAVSVDYGTVNPASFGLWGRLDGVWYRICESYFDSRREGYQKTDEEHYEALSELIGGRAVKCIAVDPSAASFIETIRRHGEYNVIPAHNDVLNGIRRTSSALKEGKIRICDCCTDSIREFSLYRWSENKNDTPVKENDHAMDDIRYFVATIYEDSDTLSVAAARR